MLQSPVWSRVRHPIVAIGALALVLRLSTLTWGTGLGAFGGWYHPDEPKAWRSVVEFPENYLTNRRFLYGTALQYTEGVVLLPFKLLWHSGHRPFRHVTYKQFAVILVRAFHALLGAATVVLLYRLALDLWDRKTALLAAALLAVAFLHVLDSALTTLDVPMGFLLMLGIFLSARAAETLRLREFVALGLVLGYLTGSKITGAAFVVVPLTFAFTAAPAKRRRWIMGLGVGGAVAIATFTLSTPHVIVDPWAYVEFMKRQRAVWVDEVSHAPWAVVKAWIRAMAIVLSPAVAALALIGLAIGRAARPVRRLEWAVLAYLAAQVIIWRGYLPSRFVLPLAPILCGYAARALVLISASPRPWLRRAGPVLTALVLGLALAEVLGGIWTEWRDPRTQAAAGISRLVPPGSTVGFAARGASTRNLPGTVFFPGEHGVTMRVHGAIGGDYWIFPDVDSTRYRIVAASERPSFLVVSDWTPGLGEIWNTEQAPSAEQYRLHDRLLQENWGYLLVGYWAPATPLPVEFTFRSIGLYRRAVTHAPDQASAGD